MAQPITQEQFNKIREDAWNILVQLDKSLENTSLDKYITNIDETFASQFPTIKKAADKDDKSIKETADAIIISLKALTSIEEFNKYIGKGELYELYNNNVMQCLDSNDLVDESTPVSEFAKAYAISGLMGEFDDSIKNNRFESNGFDQESAEVLDYILGKAKEKYSGKVHAKRALEQFKKAVKINVNNAGYSDEEFPFKIVDLRGRQQIIKRLEEHGIGTDTLNNPYYDLFDDVPSDNAITRMNTEPLPELPNVMSLEEAKRLLEKREEEKKLEEQRVAQEQARQQKIDDEFKPYADAAKFEDALNEGLEQYAKDNSEPERESDRFRFDDKKRIEALAKLYEMWFPKDPDMQPLIQLLQSLSAMNVTAYDGYNKEIELLADIEKQLDICRNSLERQNEELKQKSHKILKITDKSGNKRWPTTEELEANPKLKAVDADFADKQNHMDRKMSALESIAQFIELRKNGELNMNNIPDDSYHITVKTEDIERPSQNTDTAHKNNDINVTKQKLFDAKDYPLFPHQPSPDDARQGAIGDCYFISTLSDIARHRPEKIREAMTENIDGTVTVRLYGKRKNKETNATEYYPVYVTVDKVIPITDDGISQIAKNSVWINCFEKAVAASGLVSSNRFDKESGILRPVQKDTAELKEKYNELKALEKQDKLDTKKINEYAADYPWLFTIRDNQTILIKWPSLNSIVGGDGMIATELIMGPEITRERDELDRLVDKERVHASDREQYINLNPTTVEQMCAIILANKTDRLKTSDFDVPCPLDLSLPPDELFDEAFKLSGLNPESKAEARNEYNDNVKSLNDYFRKYQPTANKSQMIEAAETQLTKKYGKSLLLDTLQPLKEKAYNKVQVEVYNNIEKCLKNHLPVSAASKPKDSQRIAKLSSNHQYSIIGVYTDDLGRRMIRLKNPWGETAKNGIKTTFNEDGSRTYTKITAPNGEFEMELKDCMEEMSYVEYSKGKDIPARTAPQKIEGNILNLNTILSYTDAIDKVCQDFQSTDRWYGGHSDTFKLMRNQLKLVRVELPLIKTKEKLADTLERLSQKIADYEEHCARKPRIGDPRRNTKLKATKDLKNIIEAARQNYISPKYYQKELNIKRLNKNIQSCNTKLKQAFESNNAKDLIESVSEKMYYIKLSEEVPSMSSNKLDNAMKQENCLSESQKLYPVVAKEIASMEKTTIERFVKDSDIDQRIRSMMKHDFQSIKSVDDAKKQVQSNIAKINDTMLGKAPATKSK